jgi:Fe-S-cluster containining protein
MRFTLNTDNLLDIINLSPADSVQSVCDALDEFLKENQLPCDVCPDSCCRLFPIRPDNVFVRHISSTNDMRYGLGFMDRQYTMPFIKDAKGSLCEYNQNGKCSIYSLRPVLCKLYTCLPATKKWSSLLDIIVQSYKNALEYEIMEQIVKSYGNRAKQPTHSAKSVNLTLYAVDYSLQIGNLLSWAKENKWTDINFWE